MLSIYRYAKSKESLCYFYFYYDTFDCFYFYALLDLAEVTLLLVPDWINPLFSFFFTSTLKLIKKLRCILLRIRCILLWRWLLVRKWKCLFQWLRVLIFLWLNYFAVQLRHHLFLFNFYIERFFTYSQTTSK